MIRKGIVRIVTWLAISLVPGILSFPAFAGENFPQRIISLVPTATEEIYILGAEDRLIANTIYCTRPSEANKKEKVGTIREVNVEKIVGLKPDLVLATSLTNAKAKEKLKALGIRVETFPYAKNFKELCGHFLLLGKIIGKEKEVRQIIKDAERDVADIRNRVRNLAKPGVFIQIGAKPLYTANRDSFLNDFIELGSGINIASEAKSGLYTREMVLNKNPDVIIIATMGIAGEKEQENWNRFKSINAVKNKRIHTIDSDRFCSCTPVTFVDGLREIVEILHPGSER